MGDSTHRVHPRFPAQALTEPGMATTAGMTVMGVALCKPRAMPLPPLVQSIRRDADRVP